MKVSATFLYSGLPDYWRGNSDRWEDNKGCLFSYYDHRTTLQELVDGWVEDFCMGGDCDSLPDDVSDCDIHSALMEMLTDSGRADYYGGAIAECAAEYGAVNELSDDDDWDDCCDSPVAIVLIECEV